MAKSATINELAEILANEFVLEVLHKLSTAFATLKVLLAVMNLAVLDAVSCLTGRATRLGIRHEALELTVSLLSLHLWDYPCLSRLS